MHYYERHFAHLISITHCITPYGTTYNQGIDVVLYRAICGQDHNFEHPKSKYPTYKCYFWLEFVLPKNAKQKLKLSTAHF
jgi:hypothetical protein